MGSMSNVIGRSCLLSGSPASSIQHIERPQVHTCGQPRQCPNSGHNPILQVAVLWLSLRAGCANIKGVNHLPKDDAEKVPM